MPVTHRKKEWRSLKYGTEGSTSLTYSLKSRKLPRYLEDEARPLPAGWAASRHSAWCRRWLAVTDVIFNRLHNPVDETSSALPDLPGSSVLELHCQFHTLATPGADRGIPPLFTVHSRQSLWKATVRSHLLFPPIVQYKHANA